MRRFKQFLGEAFTEIPKTVEELITMDLDNIDAVPVYQEVIRRLTAAGISIPDPLAFSRGKKTEVKVLRSIADEIDLSSLRRMFTRLKIVAGDGSRGGRGAKNKGLGFEGQIIGDLETYKVEGIQSKNFQYPKMIQDMYDSFLHKHKDIEVLAEGDKNQRRSLVYDDLGILIGGTDINIGHLVTDVTVVGDGFAKYYLSAKFGGTVTFFNSGVMKIFTEDQFKQGKFNHNAAYILDMLGINHQRFIEIFEKWNKKTARRRADITRENVTRDVNMRSLIRLLATGVGYGYYMVHKKGKRVLTYEMDVNNLKKSIRPKSVTVLYPKPGQTKRIDIEILTEKFKFRINIRNKQGGIYPSHIMCDYTYNE